MLGRLHELAEAHKDFAFETTLASRFYAGWLKELQTKGYRTSLIFLWIENAELAIERVSTRVQLGGHSIPEETIRRRYERGLKNLFELYLPVVDNWRVFDASPRMPVEVVRFTEATGKVIFHEDIWTRIKP